ncbi:hypothetical protein GGR52DRAFT_591879 [Hypoxylon sp. FL1284]|nr:hypothetical protein GGR52DRAFT_591879 [Hypoxylon sp. FL1284]
MGRLSGKNARVPGPVKDELPPMVELRAKPSPEKRKYTIFVEERANPSQGLDLPKGDASSVKRRKRTPVPGIVIFDRGSDASGGQQGVPSTPAPTASSSVGNSSASPGDGVWFSPSSSRLGETQLRSDPDDPELEEGATPGMATVGFKFQFLVAGASEDDVPDLHPNDSRPLLRRTRGYTMASPEFQLTVRNAIVDAVRANGMVAVKGPSDRINLDRQDNFTWASRLDDQRDTNLEALMDWVGEYRWNSHLSGAENLREGALRILAQFVQFHKRNGLQFSQTPRRVIEAIGERVPKFVLGASKSNTLRVGINWTRRTLEMMSTLRQRQEAQDALEVDPLSVYVEGADPKYLAWTCDWDDGGIPAWYADSSDYDVSTYVAPTGQEELKPPNGYKWFNARLSSPILDLGKPKSMATVDSVCAAIRDSLRVHKPYSRMETGVHFNFGFQDGWTLLHLKKLASLCLMFENVLERFHERYQSEFEGWQTRSIRDNTDLSRFLVRPDISVDVQSTVESRNRRQMVSYYGQVDAHVDLRALGADGIMQRLISEIWQYDNITDFSQGMLVRRGGKGNLRFRVDGDKRTGAPHDDVLQTVEFRILQGTLDSTHILHWLAICQALVMFAKDTPAEEFRLLTSAVLNGEATLQKILNIPVDTIEYFYSRVNRDTGYFEHPDQDHVDWANPFMAKGNKDMYA